MNMDIMNLTILIANFKRFKNSLVFTDLQIQVYKTFIAMANGLRYPTFWGILVFWPLLFIEKRLNLSHVDSGVRWL